MKVTIEITEEDIRNGKHGSCGECPAALALGREFPKYRISMGVTGCNVLGYGRYLRFDNPLSLQKWIMRFESEENVLPIRVTLVEEGTK